MLLVDAHLDLASNALTWNRDITLPVSEIRSSETGMPEKGRAGSTVSLPELRRAEVAVCLATVFARTNPSGSPPLDYRTQEISYAVAQGQLAYYRVQESKGLMRMLRTQPALKEHVIAWTAGGDAPVPLGFILSMEGADPVTSPRRLDSWQKDGLHVLSLAHYGQSTYAHGTGSSGGLTERGRELLEVMEELGLVLDVTHLSEESFWEATRLFRGPILASHNNCRALVPGDRQFSDDQVRCLIERDAVIGVAFDAWMLTPNWVYGRTPRDSVSIETAVDHIDHICQLAGNAGNAGIGSDLDGGYGIEQCPQDLDTITDLQKIPELLGNRGYSEADVRQIMHGNWLCFFEKSLPAG
jgi:membrane dipeptidase